MDSSLFPTSGENSAAGQHRHAMAPRPIGEPMDGLQVRWSDLKDDTEGGPGQSSREVVRELDGHGLKVQDGQEVAARAPTPLKQKKVRGCIGCDCCQRRRTKRTVPLFVSALALVLALVVHLTALAALLLFVVLALVMVVASVAFLGVLCLYMSLRIGFSMRFGAPQIHLAKHASIDGCRAMQDTPSPGREDSAMPKAVEDRKEDSKSEPEPHPFQGAFSLEELTDPLVWKQKEVLTQMASERQSLLPPETFMEVFEMDKEAFDQLPRWRQDELKKQRGLF